MFLKFFLEMFIYLYKDIKSVFIEKHIFDGSYFFDVIPSHSYHIITNNTEIPQPVKAIVLSNLLREAISYPYNYKRFKALLTEEYSEDNLTSKINFLGLFILYSK